MGQCLKYRTDCINQACKDFPTEHHTLSIHPLLSSPRTATMEQADNGNRGETHLNTHPNSSSKYNWGYISAHKLYGLVGVTLKKKKPENSYWQEPEKQSATAIVIEAEWLTPRAIPVTTQIMPRLTKTLSMEDRTLEILRTILQGTEHKSRRGWWNRNVLPYEIHQQPLSSLFYLCIQCKKAGKHHFFFFKSCYQNWHLDCDFDKSWTAT